MVVSIFAPRLKRVPSKAGLLKEFGMQKTDVVIFVFLIKAIVRNV
jgi:hypothetical protein